MRLTSFHLLAFPAALVASCVRPESGANPRFAGADPAALVDAGALWVFPTDRGDRLRAWSSADLRTWRQRGLMIRRSDIAWIAADGAPRHYLWAPDVVRDGSRYLLYYSVGPQNPTPSRIGVATGRRPEGPFVDSGRPLLTGGDGFEAIDPMVFRDPASGHHYLYAGGSAGATLRVYRLTPDLLAIDRRLEVAQPAHFTEGAFMHVRGGVYYLSYSSGSWQHASYSVHYSTAPSPTGPWRYRGVLLTSDARYQGPGHHSFAQDPRTGSDLIIYHRWEGKRGPGPYRGTRMVAIEAVRYRPDGTIVPITMTP